MYKQKSINYFFLLTSFACYCLMAFYIERFQTVALLSCFGFLFLIYLWIICDESKTETTFWVYAAILFRLCFLFATPLLSDDFYRFIWDGRLLAAGIHPFAELPRYYIENSSAIPGIDLALFRKLNSPDYFTIYPPVNQFVFLVASKLSLNSILASVITMRLFLLAAEIGSILLIKKILDHHQLRAKNVLLYAINPLVIIELTGNLHFEALLIFFLLLSYWLLIKGQLISSAINLSFAICSKLLPVIFLPLLLIRLRWKKSLIYYFVVGASTLIFFLPLFSTEIISGFNQSIGYYFKKFEFNASIYYLVREWGFWKYGYNIIQTVGWKLAVYCTATILLYAVWDAVQISKFKIQISKFKVEVNLIESLVIVLTIYFVFSTTVHPWYITTLVALSALTHYRFTILWSGLIFLTYVGYSQDFFSENLYIVTTEYVLVFSYLAYELIWKRKRLLI